MTPLPDLSLLDHPAKDALILRLWEQVAKLTDRVAALEAISARPPKTPDNSSKPPSSSPKASGGSNGQPAGGKRRRKGRKGHHRALHPDPNATLDCKLSRCPCCAAEVSQAGQYLCEAYDHIDIPPILPVVTRVNLYGATCQNCAKSFKASPPRAMPPGSPFGAGVRALVLHLRYTQGIAFERLSKLLADCFGLKISQGALINMIASAAQPFAEQVERIRGRLLAGSALASDETGLRIGARNGWLWVVHHGDSAAFIADPSRAKRVLTDFLGDHRPQIWLSDRYGGQKGFATKAHQYCLAHLIRDAQYAIDAGDKIFAPSFLELLKRACRLARKRPELNDEQLRSFHRRYVRKLSGLLERQSDHPEGRALQKAMAKSRKNLFVFITNRQIEPTNNGCERALRPCATFRKITNGFRTQWGADFYAHIRSVLETARRRAINPLHAITLTLQGRPLPLETG
jgi:transposase